MTLTEAKVPASGYIYRESWREPWHFSESLPRTWRDHDGASLPEIHRVVVADTHLPTPAPAEPAGEPIVYLTEAGDVLSVDHSRLPEIFAAMPKPPMGMKTIRLYAAPPAPEAPTC